jgi:hypothetical protein
MKPAGPVNGADTAVLMLPLTVPRPSGRTMNQPQGRWRLRTVLVPLPRISSELFPMPSTPIATARLSFGAGDSIRRERVPASSKIHAALPGYRRHGARDDGSMVWSVSSQDADDEYGFSNEKCD